MTTPRPFLTLPPETRLNIYQYLLPNTTHPLDHNGLRQTCRTVRNEFDHETNVSKKKEYKQLKASLTKENITIVSSFQNVVATSTLKLRLAEKYLDPTAVLPPQVVP
jgi:hypothetical protein